MPRIALMAHVSNEEFLREMETEREAFTQNQKQNIEISETHNEGTRLGKLDGQRTR